MRICELPSPGVMRKRLEDRIRVLCLEATVTPESPELNEILQELRAALAEHIRRVRTLAADFPAISPERRCNNPPSGNSD